MVAILLLQEAVCSKDEVVYINRMHDEVFNPVVGQNSTELPKRISSWLPGK